MSNIITDLRNPEDRRFPKWIDLHQWVSLKGYCWVHSPSGLHLGPKDDTFDAFAVGDIGFNVSVEPPYRSVKNWPQMLADQMRNRKPMLEHTLWNFYENDIVHWCVKMVRNQHLVGNIDFTTKFEQPLKCPSCLENIPEAVLVLWNMIIAGRKK